MRAWKSECYENYVKSNQNIESVCGPVWFWFFYLIMLSFVMVGQWKGWDHVMSGHIFVITKPSHFQHGELFCNWINIKRNQRNLPRHKEIPESIQMFYKWREIYQYKIARITQFRLQDWTDHFIKKRTNRMRRK